MKYALEKPEIVFPDGKMKKRLIIDAISSNLDVLRADFNYCLKEMRTDPETEKMVKREP